MKRYLFLLLLALIGAICCPAAQACDALVGSYATDRNAPAQIWIERIDQRFVISIYDAQRHDWAAYHEPTRTLTHEQLAEMPVEIDRRSCGLASTAGVLVKTRVGAQFSLPPVSQNFSATTKQSETGVVLVGGAGFAVGGMDLYPVRDTPLPPPPPASAAAAQRENGCPGGKPADLTAARIAALPAALQQVYKAGSDEFRLDFTCGQYLDGLMVRDSGLIAWPDRPHIRAATLETIRSLVQAGAVPRNEDGEADWWAAVTHVLMRNEPASNGDAAPELQREYYALFAQDLFPHLEASRGSATKYAAQNLIRYAVNLPDADALRTLELIASMQGQGDRDDFNRAIVDRLNGELRQPVYDWIVKRAGVAAIDQSDVLMKLVDHDDVDGVRRLLASGASPFNLSALSRASGKSAAAQALASSLTPYAARHGKPTAKQADALLAQAIDGCSKSVNTERIALARSFGADATRVFQHPRLDEETLAVTLLYCPSIVTPLLATGLKPERTYPRVVARGADSSNVDDNALIGYLRVSADRMTRSPEVVRALVQAHNNVNEPDKRADAHWTPLEYAIASGDIDIVKILLERGANPQLKDASGIPAWLRVIPGDRADMLPLIFAAAPKLDMGPLSGGISPLAYALCARNLKVAAVLRQRGAPEIGTLRCEEEMKAQR